MLTSALSSFKFGPTFGTYMRYIERNDCFTILFVLVESTIHGILPNIQMKCSKIKKGTYWEGGERI